tara:strand:+ start:56 stop:235 length:180 start_codon:yes stop_codon:yes gene_type:complete
MRFFKSPRRDKMHFEVDGEGWERLWTEETRLVLVVFLFLVVLFNLLVPLGEDKCKEKAN